MGIYESLRTANATRQKEWDKDDGISLVYRGNELLGEVGEAANIIKKLDRERLGIRGSRATPDQLAEELSDVIICSDLVAMALDLDLADAMRSERGRMRAWLFGHDVPDGMLSYYGNVMGRLTGEVCNFIYMLERDGFGLPYVLSAAKHDYVFMLARLCLCVEKIARVGGINLDQAVIDKFNATSRKVGLTTMMSAE